MSKVNDCFHCGSGIPEGGAPIYAEAHEPVAVCCLGCKAVTEHIVRSGLSSYYEFRSDLASKPNDSIDLEQYRVYDDTSVLDLVATAYGDQHFRISLTVENIHCAACAWLIEQSMQQIDGVESVTVNTITQRAEISWNQSLIALSQVLTRLSEIGYPATPFKICDSETQFKSREKAYVRRLGVAGLFTMQVMMLAFALYFGAFTNMEPHQVVYFKWISMALSLPVIFYSAKPFLTGAFTAIRSRRLTMDVPVSVAIYGAFFASFYQLLDNGLEGTQGEVYFESICMFTFLLLIGKYLEFKAKGRALLSNANLNSSMPLTVNKWLGSDTQTVLVKDLRVGDELLIKPGERVPIDGTVVFGSSSINESVLNGEFEPITKHVGDSVFAGSINTDGSLRIKVTAIGEQTTLSQIAHLQQEFAGHKPAFSQFADSIAHWFVLSQLILAFITYLIWHWVSPADALWVSLSVLVATCPCALSLATPTAYTCVMSALNKKGILIKDPHAFDKLSEIDKIGFDKTGTLTIGRFVIRAFVTLPHCEDQDLAYLIQMQRHSEHPIAKAFTSEALKMSKEIASPLSDIRVHVGAGVSARVDRHEYRVGTADFCQQVTKSKDNVYFSKDGELLATFLVGDEIKLDAKTTINELVALEKDVCMLTGDPSLDVERVVNELKIADFHKGCSPEKKATLIQQSQRQGKRIMMIGDGINDAPVFAASDVSVAMGSGADLSKFTSDIIVLNNNLSAITTLIDAANKTNRVIKQNLIWSLIYNLVILPVAMLGYVAPYIAVIGMSASSILVVTHSLKLLKLER